MTANIKQITTNKALIDSFSLKIPLDQVKVLDHRLTSETCIYYEELDAVDDILHPPKPWIYESLTGIKIRISLASIPNYNQETGRFDDEPKKYVSLTVSSKLLERDYFDGINKKNIKIIYNAFLDFKVFWCPLSVFLDGIVNDVDICVNMRVPSLDIFSLSLHSIFNQADIRKKHLKIFEDPKGMGLQFNKREWAVPSLPFLKIYHKELELKNR